MVHKIPKFVPVIFLLEGSLKEYNLLNLAIVNECDQIISAF